MATDRTPREGQIYTAPDGAPIIYVRTETRPRQGPSHLFLVVRDRIIYERWCRVDEPLPDEWTLAVDALAVQRAEEAQAKLDAATRERDALTKAMRAAVAVLPESEADKLRNVYREALRG